MPVIIDTNIFSLYLRGDKNIVSKNKNIHITSVTILESLGGWQAELNRTTNPERISLIHESIATTSMGLAIFDVLPFSLNSIPIFNNLKSQKLNIGSFDLKIAAIALDHNMVLVTRNTRDFERINGLTLEDWQDD